MNICSHSKYAFVLSDFSYLVMYKTSANVYNLKIDESSQKYSSIKLLNLKIDCFLNIYSSGIIKSKLKCLINRLTLF